MFLNLWIIFALKETSIVHFHNVRGASNNVFVARPRTEAAKEALRYRGDSHVEWPRKCGQRRDKSQLFQVCSGFDTELP